MITIVDYGMGNLGSLENMLKRVGGTVRFSNEPNEIASSEQLVLPGVGHFDQAMKKLHKLDLVEALNYSVLKLKTPILCICLGAQLATESSEEGSVPGFGWIPGRTVSFKLPAEYKIPHMGWNDVNVKKKSRLFQNLPIDPCFYFVHSFYLDLEDENDILTTTFFGTEFVSSFERGNIVGMQFHPEKSHKYGICIMKNFVELQTC